ncbi:unnamed protein product, partial [Notodromas monacha]
MTTGRSSSEQVPAPLSLLLAPGKRRLLLGTAAAICCLIQIFVPGAQTSPDTTFTNSFYVRLRRSMAPDAVEALAGKHGFQNWGKVLQSDHEYHWVHQGLQHSRRKRSIPLTRKLKTDSN